MASRGADLTDFQKGQIHALKYHAHFSIPKIAECLEISENTIKKFLQRLPGDAEGTNRSACGRKKVTCDRDDEKIIRMSSENPFMSAKEIKHDLNLQCSTRTVSNRLREAGLKSFTPARKTFLAEEHQERRHEWAQQKSSWSA